MAESIAGTRVAFVVDNEGVEQVELTEPWKAVQDAGGTPTLLAPTRDDVQAFNHADKATRSASTTSSARPTPRTTTRSCSPAVW